MSRCVFDRIAGQRLLAILFFIVVLTINAVPVNGAVINQRTFKDVSTGDWFYDEVTLLVSRGIVSGYEDSTFRPDNTVTVAEFLKMSIEAVDRNLVYTTGGKWYDTYVKTALRDGVIRATEFDNYDRPITRSEMGSIVDKLLGLNTAQREDYYKYIADINQVSENYKSSMIDVFVAGIITGYDDQSIRGNNNAKRSEASVVIVRMIDGSKRSPFDVGAASVVQEMTDESTTDNGNPVIVSGVSSPELVKENALADNELEGQVELGMSFDEVKALLGTGYNSHTSQYGYTWYCYVSDYNNMEFVGIANSKVVAYYTNNNLEDVKISGGTQIATYYNNANNQRESVMIVDSRYTTMHSITSSVIHGMEQISFYLINGTRAKNGLGPLNYSSDAASVAEEFSHYLNQVNRLTHYDADGNNSKQRMLNAGIPQSNGYGENVSRGFKDPFTIHDAFVHSPGHLPNILDSRFKYVGIGIIYDASDSHKYYVTVDFYNTK